MKKSTRSQQSRETKNIIARAKKMIDNDESYKVVCEFVKKSYEDMAVENGYFDNLQFNKAIKSVADYVQV